MKVFSAIPSKDTVKVDSEKATRPQTHIATPVKLTPEEHAALDHAMKNCCIDTCDEDSLHGLARNTGMELDAGTIFEKLAKLTTVPIASGKSREPVVFILDSLNALEDKKC